MKVAVTGGAGFIGSHLAEELIGKDREVVVLDDLSSGKQENVPEEAEFVEVDLNDRERVVEALEGVEKVYHLAANSDVKTQNSDREADIHDGYLATRNLLEAMKSAGVEDLVFTSSSTVYGEDVEIPTPEEHLSEPISLYGATKHGAESLISAYCHSFGLNADVLRLANIIGGRSRKGVTYDFVKKLEDDSSELEVLGNGEQRKSYLHVDDCVEALTNCSPEGFSVLNVGNTDAVSVTRIAEVVIDEFGYDANITYTGGEKGWTGDVPVMLLDITRIQDELDWQPSMNSEEAVRETAKQIIEA